MSMNDFKPSASRLQQEAILAGRLAKTGGACMGCGGPLKIWKATNPDGSLRLVRVCSGSHANRYAGCGAAPVEM